MDLSSKPKVAHYFFYLPEFIEDISKDLQNHIDINSPEGLNNKEKQQVFITLQKRVQNILSSLKETKKGFGEFMEQSLAIRERLTRRLVANS